MRLHVPMVGAPGRSPTSAEPSTDPWAALQICHRAVLADRFADLYGRDAPSMRAVLEAARVVEATVQERLRAAGGAGAVLDLRYARELWDAQWQAHEAVVAKTGKRKPAKTIQGAAAVGPPLTVCVGRRARRMDEHVMRFNAADMFDDDEHPGYVPFVPLGNGDGCGRIVEDTPAVRPSRPRRYCDRCGARAGNTPNAGLYKSALARLRASRRLERLP